MSSRQESLGFLLADVSRLMRQAFSQRLEGSALTLAQARALIYVSRNEGLRQVELADMLEIQPISLARLIDQLADAGLVERRPDPADRRAYQLFLKPAATAELAAIEAVTASIRRDALAGIAKPQADAVLAALKTMRANLAALPRRPTKEISQ
ncbi:MarR family winged helix-turn-helix transcriptional regulator [Thiobacillus sedimenti]|uniref:MarR family transcriptional regulator n=1 Tax=Thiobacillus sedimenti TaxID=3110231 RepID=A0ABZ1CLB1_9PROT|nr:MarR family transcriptional regulator [Thiobacillus sp. SCUT-2]WRS40170.1 MarR family transcriptional regulator [Thiobacillus sp. SCUT-2]